MQSKGRGLTDNEKLFVDLVEKGEIILDPIEGTCYRPISKQWAGRDITKDNYPRTVYRNGKIRKAMYIHKLMWIVFIGDYDYKDMNINHKDGNKSNFKLSNLELVKQFQNVQHSRVNGLNEATAKIDEKIVKLLFEDFVEHKISVRKLSEKYNITGSMIYRIIGGLAWKDVETPYRDKVKMSNKGGSSLALSQDKVNEIIELCKDPELTIKQIAEKASVSESVIKRYGNETLRARKFSRAVHNPLDLL